MYFQRSPGTVSKAYISSRNPVPTVPLLLFFSPPPLLFFSPVPLLLFFPPEGSESLDRSGWWCDARERLQGERGMGGMGGRGARREVRRWCFVHHNGA